MHGDKFAKITSGQIEVTLGEIHKRVGASPPHSTN